MAFIDYYKILGIDKSASQDDIKKAYRKLARKFHPDLHPNDESAKQMFQQINEANEVLSDPEKRKKYDQYGENWQHADQYEEARRQQQAGGGFGGQGSDWHTYTSTGEDGGDFSDFFRSMFGNEAGGATGMGGGFGRSRSRAFKGQDYHAELQLSLAEASRTHKQELSIGDKKVRITIPAGVYDGQQIRLTGYGAPGQNGSPSGDLYITFVIPEDPVFKRVGDDLYITRELDLYTAVLGGEVLINTMDGEVKLKVAPETQNGTRVRLRGKGFPVYKKEGQYGDLYVTWNVRIPTHLTEKQKELFRELAKS